jgi:hypothetical protein
MNVMRSVFGVSSLMALSAASLPPQSGKLQPKP